MSKIDKNYIKQKLQNILNSVHNIEEKKKIKEYPNRYNIACPICMDSQKSIYKKRGNLYDNLRYKCFNCGDTMSFTKLCDKFDESIEMEERIKIYNYIDNNTYYKKTDEYVIEELDKLIEIDDFVKYFNNKKNSYLIDIKPVEKNSHVYQYLKYDRLISNFSQIYQGVYRFIRDGVVKFQTRVLINMNMSIDAKKLLGIQIRNLESGSKRFYKIIDFEQLYNYMYPDNKLDDIEAISYNKLSHFYNILNIDFDRAITIFEGFLDSLFFPNSLGLVGASNDEDILKFLTQSDANLKLKFFYDNDLTGLGKSVKMLRRGETVFLWNKLFDELIKNKRDKNKAKKIYSQITDLNKLVIIAKNPNVYNKLKLEKFFSIDELDIMYLDKISYDKDNDKFYIKK